MGLIYKLVGFDRDTEYLALSFDIPGEKIRKAKIVAGIADNPIIVCRLATFTRPGQGNC